MHACSFQGLQSVICTAFLTSVFEGLDIRAGPAVLCSRQIVRSGMESFVLISAFTFFNDENPTPGKFPV